MKNFFLPSTISFLLVSALSGVVFAADYQLSIKECVQPTKVTSIKDGLQVINVCKASAEVSMNGARYPDYRQFITVEVRDSKSQTITLALAGLSDPYGGANLYFITLLDEENSFSENGGGAAVMPVETAVLETRNGHSYLNFSTSERNAKKLNLDGLKIIAKFQTK